MREAEKESFRGTASGKGHRSLMKGSPQRRGETSQSASEGDDRRRARRQRADLPRELCDADGAECDDDDDASSPWNDAWHGACCPGAADKYGRSC